VGAFARTKHPQKPPEDQIRVVAHIPLSGGAVERFDTTKHYQRNYLYAEYQSGKGVAVIDVTKPESPVVLAEAAYPADVKSNSLVAVAGSAALVAGSPAMSPSSTSAPARTIRIMSFAQPDHPAVQQQFDGVTAIGSDARRGLVFLSNADGLWVLQEELAIDPAEEARWEHEMLDNH
jgi:hypothetical protein